MEQQARPAAQTVQQGTAQEVVAAAGAVGTALQPSPAAPVLARHQLLVDRDAVDMPPASSTQAAAAAATAVGAASSGNECATPPAHMSSQQKQEAASRTAGPTKPASPTPWLQHVRDIYSTISVPMEAADVRLVGPLRRADIPLSAVDFHVSDVLPHLLGCADVRQALQELTCASWGAEADHTHCLRSAM